MPSRLAAWLVLLLGAAPAHAVAPDFSPHQLSLGVEGDLLLPSHVDPLIGSLGVTIGYALFLGSGFSFEARAAPSVGWQRASPQVLAVSGQVGFRYLFLEELVRPWVGASLAGLGVMRTFAPTFYAGPATSVGVDVFVAESISIGARADLALLLTLNAPMVVAPSGSVVASTYF